MRLWAEDPLNPCLDSWPREMWDHKCMPFEVPTIVAIYYTPVEIWYKEERIMSSTSWHHVDGRVTGEVKFSIHYEKVCTPIHNELSFNTQSYTWYRNTSHQIMNGATRKSLQPWGSSLGGRAHALHCLAQCLSHSRWSINMCCSVNNC